MFTGLLLKESLQDESILETLNVTGTETWQAQNAAPWQPAVWTAIRFQAEDDQADALCEALSRAIQPRWYIDGGNAETVYVVFAGKVFKYRRGDAAQQALARGYALGCGVPPNQVDWGE